MQRRSELIKRIARSVGFAACGICDAEPITRHDYVADWLRRGCHGEMAYLERYLDVRLDPGKLLCGAQSVIMVAWLYRVAATYQPLTWSEATGHIARYAWGRDYHRVIRSRLRRLVDQLRLAIPQPFESRICVDTAPLLEREMATRAGLGWIGNNCMVINPELGSYFCLGAVVTTLKLAVDKPAMDRCGRCTRCLAACPTGALIAPKQMDARKCISYQTIEQRTPNAEAHLAGQLFGCDICQQVCAYNGPQAPVTDDSDAQPRSPAGQIDPQQVLLWTEADWDKATRGRSLRRATPQMWQRNARNLLRGDQ